MNIEGTGLSDAQRTSFRVMALETLKYKRQWTHGEISYDFTVRQGMILVDATMESNYNMANLMIRYPRTNTYLDSGMGSTS